MTYIINFALIYMYMYINYHVSKDDGYIMVMQFIEYIYRLCAFLIYIPALSSDQFIISAPNSIN